MRIVTLLLVSTAAFAAPCLGQTCTGSGSAGATQACNQMIESSQILQARSGIALSGGNPVPGASSTLGMRIGSVPRVSVGLRATGVGVSTPALDVTSNNASGLAHSLNVDASVGLFSGFVLAPTIGGFGSFDVVASAGKLTLPSDIGLQARSPGSWALGARVGILRESFTAPGISVTALYRRVGDINGVKTVNTPAGAFMRTVSLSNNSDFSVRGVIGKRLFVVGANAGLGVDSYHSDVRAASSSSGTPQGTVDGAATYTLNGYKQSRVTGFVNATWTMLILNFVAEAGYQRGGDAFTGSLGSTQSSKTQNAGYYGSLAVRLAL